jgi:hypothetical protein
MTAMTQPITGQTRRESGGVQVPDELPINRTVVALDSLSSRLIDQIGFLEDRLKPILAAEQTTPRPFREPEDKDPVEVSPLTQGLRDLADRYELALGRLQTIMSRLDL